MRKIATKPPAPMLSPPDAFGDVCVPGDATFARNAIAVLSKMTPAAAAATAGAGWQRAMYGGCHRKTGSDRAKLAAWSDRSPSTSGQRGVAAARREQHGRGEKSQRGRPALALEGQLEPKRRRLVFVVKSALSRPVFAARFAGFGGVEVVGTQPIEDQIGNVTAFAASANTFGNMDGGIDRVDAALFGWPYGLPYTEVNPLQLVATSHWRRLCRQAGCTQVAPTMAGAAGIAGGGGRDGSTRNPGFPEPGVGAPALGVPAGPGGASRSLIASATMDVPGALPAKSRNVCAAFAAIMRAWRAWSDLGSMAKVPFGTEFGGLPDEVSANQMFEAFLTA